LIPNGDGLTAEEIQCTLTALTPDSSLNIMGGDNITFTGTFLPRDLSKTEVTVTFDDSQSTVCNPQVSSSNTLVCQTEAFDESDLSVALNPTVVINAKTLTHSQSLNTNSLFYSATGMTPTQANPVLKTDIVIQLDTDFPYTLNKDDFSVNATDVYDSTYVRYLKVNEVDDAAKTITARFGGAESSTFVLRIRHAQYGLIKSEDLILDVNAYVTSISPSTGSIYGGTLLTIAGGVFGDSKYDNPVQLSFDGGVNSIDCYV
jgi:hypothetical protein